MLSIWTIKRVWSQLWNSLILCSQLLPDNKTMILMELSRAMLQMRMKSPSSYHPQWITELQQWHREGVMWLKPEPKVKCADEWPICWLHMEISWSPKPLPQLCSGQQILHSDRVFCSHFEKKMENVTYDHPYPKLKIKLHEKFKKHIREKLWEILELVFLA